MRLTIFWRLILAQSVLIAIIFLISLYSHTKLSDITAMGETIVTRDSECVKEEKQLLKVFLSQIRIAEKYLLFNDPELKESFLASSAQFQETWGNVSALVDSDTEREALAKISELHRDYEEEIEKAASTKKNARNKKDGAERRRELSDVVLDMTNDLIRSREESIALKTTAARDISAEAARRTAWMALGGISIAVLLALFHARGVSNPLRRLSREMRRVGRGEFSRSVHIRAPREVHDLASTFNWMTERLAELDRLKSDFTAHFSHELRTPITAIREGTALLLEENPGRLNASQREILEVIHNHSEQLFQTISSILDLSKMEAQMMEYEFVPSDVGDIVKRSVQKVDLIARCKQIDLQVKVPETVPILRLDEKRIQQVLDNLLSNALKFTDNGGSIVLDVSSSPATGDGPGELRVRVTDSGEGIPLKEQGRIFERYYQGCNGKTGSLQGTGLGLALARFILEAHKGKIWVESEPDRGASFVFSLPMEPTDTGLNHV